MIRRAAEMPWWAVAVVLTMLAGEAQQRDRPAPQSAGEPIGSVSGLVTLSAESDDPVRSAIVSLIPAGGGDGASSVTDDQGRFVIRGVRDGRYSLVAQKPAYLTTYYGAKRHGRTGVPIVVSNGQAIDGLRLVLRKGAVITGRLSQENGAPARDVEVLAIPASHVAAGGRFDSRARRFYSDDEGIYRIYGLPPGDYIVGALPELLGLAEVERRTATEYEEAVRELMRRTSRPAEAAGDETVPAGPPVRVGYAPMYYPGTPVAGEAAAVRAHVGSVRDGVDIPVLMFRMSRISGVVLDVNGMPTRGAQLTVTASGPPLPIAGSRLRLTAPDAEGRFTISGVPPGVYTLTARGGGVTVDGRRGTMTLQRDYQSDWATTRVHVLGDDLDGVLLALQRGLTFSGRVELTDGNTPPSLEGTRIALVSPGSDPSMARFAMVREDGAFSVMGIHPDTYEVMVRLPSALAARWGVRGVMAGGVDLRDRPLTFEHGSIGDVTIVLTDQRTEIAGTLSTMSGAPATDYFIVIFPELRTLWHPHSPRVRVVRPAVDGSFSARDLPAGAYRLTAVSDLDGDEWRQAAFLESLLEASLPIEVKEGTTTRQALRVE